MNNEIDYFLEPLKVEESYKFRAELLLHPNIPKPLHGVAPRTLMKKKEWDHVRRTAYAKLGYHCFACGLFASYDEERRRFEDVKLHAHEVYRIDYENCVVELYEIVAVCPLCHDYIHCGRANALYDKGIFDEESMYVIINRGDSVLKAAGLPLGFVVDKRDYSDSWSKWKLVYDGKEYFSQFKSELEWKEHYE